MEVFRELRFESAHWLPKVPEDHKCRRLHGHSFRVDVHVSGAVDPELGWLIDFGDIDLAFAPIHEALDHRCLNDVAGLENPTSENLAQWIWQRLGSTLPGLSCVVVRETCDSGCIYTGP
jgi:6-pyruvoyltetrahydropterin/6-carboxytetrahydropterin synthase